MVVGYCRVSTKEQGSDGCSLVLQEQKVRAYCELHDLGEPEIMADVASGKDLERPAMAELVQLCAAGKVEAVVIYKLDRLTRSVRDLDHLVNAVFNGRVALHSVSETLNTANAAGRMVMNILATVSQWERELIGERTSDALLGKVARGERVGAAPLGYRSGSGALTMDDEEQATVRRIFDLRQSGLSMRRIADALNQDEVPTKRGGRWHQQTVRLVLNNPKHQKAQGTAAQDGSGGSER